MLAALEMLPESTLKCHFVHTVRVMKPMWLVRHSFFFLFRWFLFFFCSTSTRYSVNRIHAKLFSSARQSHTPSRIIQLQRSAMDRLELEREREIGGRRRRRVSSCHLYSASIASFLMHYLLHFQLKYLEKAHIRDLHYVRSVFFFFDGLLLRTLICVYLLIPWN